ncbi:MAG: VanZ family protein, partial [Christensenellaceae bacterium]
MNYLRIGIGTFIILIPIAIILFAICYVVKYLFYLLLKRKFIVHIPIALCEFLWILTIVAILKITGIIGGNFGT